MRTKAFHSIVKTCRSTSHVRRHDGLLYNCDVRSCKGGSLASRPERLVPNRLKPGNSRMGPSSAREFAGITHLRCSDSLRSLLSHFPLQLKLGKIRNAPSVLRLASLPAVAFSMQIASLSGKIRKASSEASVDISCRTKVASPRVIM